MNEDYNFFFSVHPVHDQYSVHKYGICEIQPPIFRIFGVLQVRVRTAAQWSKAL